MKLSDTKPAEGAAAPCSRVVETTFDEVYGILGGMPGAGTVGCGPSTPAPALGEHPAPGVQPPEGGVRS